MSIEDGRLPAVQGGCDVVVGVRFVGYGRAINPKSNLGMYGSVVHAYFEKSSDSIRPPPPSRSLDRQSGATLFPRAASRLQGGPLPKNRMMLKILVLQESDWVQKGPHQGHHLLERMRAKGHDVRVVDFEIMWKNQKEKGAFSHRKIFPKIHKVIESGPVNVIRPAFFRIPGLDFASIFLTHLLETRRQIREFRPDVIVGLGILNAFTGIWLARRAGIPFIYYLIDELHKLTPQLLLRGLSKVVEQANLRRASLVLSINEALRDYTVEMGAPPERSRALAAGIDLERYLFADGSEVRQRYGFAETDLVLLFVGWLYPFSGLKEVAEELLRMPHSSPTVRLMAVGRGDLWEELKRLAEDRKADGRLILVGWQPYSELPRYLAASDICLLPAYKNDIMRNIVPIKMYEYMAAGKPVIATRLHGLVREFPEGHGVVYIDDPREVIPKALELDHSGSVVQLGGKAREFVSGSDWKTVADQFEGLLLSAAGKTPEELRGSDEPRRGDG